jgi:hypothetical protein
MTVIYHQFKHIAGKTCAVQPGKIQLNKKVCELELNKWEVDLLANHLEYTFNISLPENAFENTRTIKDVIFCIEKTVGKNAIHA